MNIKVQNNQLVVQSNISKEQYDKAKQFTPGALTAKDEDGNAKFKVALSMTSPNLTSYGTSFNAVIGGKLAFVVSMTPGISGDEAKKDIKEMFGIALAALAKYETQINTQIANELGPIDSVMEGIEVEE